MTVYYEVWHYLNPADSVILAFHEKETPVHVKNMAFMYGHFQGGDLPDLRVRKTKQKTKLEAFYEANP